MSYTTGIGTEDCIHIRNNRLMYFGDIDFDANGVTCLPWAEVEESFPSVAWMAVPTNFPMDTNLDNHCRYAYNSGLCLYLFKFKSN